MQKPWPILCRRVTIKLFVPTAFVLLNNSQRPEIRTEEEQPHQTVDKNLLIWTRIPKTGGISFEGVFLRCGSRNHVVQYHSHNFLHRRLPDVEKQREHVNHVLDSARHSKGRAYLYNRQIRFTNFSQFTEGHVQPQYFSILRDPVKRFISRFGFIRQGNNQFDYKVLELFEPDSVQSTKGNKTAWLKKSLEECIANGDPECDFRLGSHRDFPIAYICGHSDECQKFGSELALQEAKKNAEQHYQVIGLLEDIPLTLQTLEEELPNFFTGCSNFLQDMKRKNTGNKAYTISEESLHKLKSSLKLEYEFYEFIKQRLYQQTA